MNFVGHLSDSVNGKLIFITFRDALIIVFNLRCLNPASATKKVAKSHTQRGRRPFRV